MKLRRIMLCLLAVLFVGLLATWLYADANYEYPIYEMRETGRLLEYLDRYGGWERKAISIYEPDNPAWVTTVRRVAPFTLFISGLVILYLLVPWLESRIRRMPYAPLTDR